MGQHAQDAPLGSKVITLPLTGRTISNRKTANATSAFLAPPK
jgi:hypothetical protein